LGVVELGFVGENVRAGVGGDGEVSLSDKLADARPRLAAQVEKRYPPVS
jgi:hypothetical protein